MNKVFEKIIDNLYAYSDADEAEQYGTIPVIELDRAIESVKQEAEQYNNGWISCSDRLPEANQMVLATEKDSEYVILCCYEFFEGYGYGFNGSNGNVIAWMELPQTYQPKGE